MSDFIETRSFLASNVENLLENISIRRQAGKNEAEDLFGDSQDDHKQEMNWNLNYNKFSKIDVLLQEKESLGLYVSGHPLDDYKDLLQWCRDTSGRDDVYIILIDKIRKIFTKTNSMMFAMQLSVPDLEAEGIIFPKNALNLSPLLEEKELYWVKGKVQQSKKTIQNQKNAAKKAANNSDEESAEPEEIKEEGELKEYDELPKLIIEELTKFDEGIMPLFQHEEIPMSTNRLNRLKKVNWKRLKTDPKKLPEDGADLSQPKTEEQNSVQTNLPVIFLARSLGSEKLRQIKSHLKSEQFVGALEVKVDVESSEGIKRAKGTFWTTPEILNLYRK